MIRFCLVTTRSLNLKQEEVEAPLSDLLGLGHTDAAVEEKNTTNNSRYCWNTARGGFYW